MSFKSFLSFAALSVLFRTSLPAQDSKSRIEFVQTEYNFGDIDASEGTAGCEFIFYNKGSLPLVLTDVKPSCGCTTPEWTKEPVLPGRSGSIKVNYNPGGSQGSFSKSITVTSNADNPYVVLKIRGNVLNNGPVDDEYKYSIGNLKLKTIHTSFGAVIKGETSKRSIEIKNDSEEPLNLSFKDVPVYIQIKVSPTPVLPKNKALIEFVFDSKKTESWDYIVERIKVLINNKELPNNMISVTGQIKEDFSGYTSEDLMNAPKIVFDTTSFNFGEIGTKQKITHEFKFVNEGKKDLIIRRVSASCGCTVAKPAKEIIKPGESAGIIASFNPAGKKGDQNYAIIVISNDPKNYKKILRLQGIVKDK